MCAACSKFWQANKGKLRPCEYNTDPDYHIALQHAASMASAANARPAVQDFSRGGSIASTPAAMAADSPASNFDQDSDGEYKPDANDSSFATESGYFGVQQTAGRPRGDSDVSSSQPYGRPPTHMQRGGQATQQPSQRQHGVGGKQLGGKGLPPMPPSLRGQEEQSSQMSPPPKPRPGPHPSSGRVKQEASHSPLPKHPGSQQQQQNAKGSNLAPHPALPTIRLSPNRTKSQQLAAQSASPPPGRERSISRGPTARKKLQLVSQTATVLPVGRD
jgi:hypothetical protein